jgi:23S rRNA pseudouridine1911/1915/1917 synthase
MNQEMTLGEALNGQRLDVVLATRLGVTRSKIKKKIPKESLLCNGRPASFSQIVHAQDKICFFFREENAEEALVPTNLNLKILYEDAGLLVINKPSGLTVHPGAGTTQPTLVHGLYALPHDWSQFPDRERLGLVHRLDKDTTGVILVAKTPEGLENLQSQFKERLVTKEYLALVAHVIKEDSKELTWPIGRNPSDGKRMTIHGKGSREAVTRIRVLERFGDSCFVSASPLTGRTHQIRVHFHAMQHPVIGDRVYAGNIHDKKIRDRAKRPMLHSHKLTFKHPDSGEDMTWTAPLPEDMQQLLAYLRARNN